MVYQNFSMLFIICAVLSVTSCSLIESREEASAIDNASIVSGKVTFSSNELGQRYVLLFRDNNGFIERANTYAVTSNSRFTFTVLPRTFYIGAFEQRQSGRY